MSLRLHFLQLKRCEEAHVWRQKIQKYDSMIEPGQFLRLSCCSIKFSSQGDADCLSCVLLISLMLFLSTDYWWDPRIKNIIKFRFKYFSISRNSDIGGLLPIFLLCSVCMYWCWCVCRPWQEMKNQKGSNSNARPKCNIQQSDLQWILHVVTRIEGPN